MKIDISVIGQDFKTTQFITDNGIPTESRITNGYTTAVGEGEVSVDLVLRKGVSDNKQK